jgi:hypothetical protein
VQDTDISNLIAGVRAVLAERLGRGDPAGDAARLLADLETESGRRASLDELFRSRASALSPSVAEGLASILDRPLPNGLDRRALAPRRPRLPTPEQAERGVVMVYGTANPTFYRAVFERLEPGERIRMETQHGAFEMSRDEFERSFPRIARSASYLEGPPSAPGTARYVVGRAPAVIKQFEPDPNWKLEEKR